MDHYYVYYYKKSFDGQSRGGYYVYERTMPSKRDADQRVKELEAMVDLKDPSKKCYDHATWTLNHTIKGAFY